MIKLFVLLGVFLFYNRAWSQQNYFNVPSFDITHKNDIFFQQQFNVAELDESNSTFDYGLGDEMEVGFNFFGMQFNESLTQDILKDATDNKFREMLLANFQKGFELSDAYTLSFGFQAGDRRIKKQDHFAIMTYSALTYSRNKKLRFTIGPWYANSKYSKDVATVGIQAGFEYNLEWKKLSLIADSISGDTPLSVTVVGFCTHLIDNWPLSFGLQIPNSLEAGQAFVVEITYRKNDK